MVASALQPIRLPGECFSLGPSCGSTLPLSWGRHGEKREHSGVLCGSSPEVTCACLAAQIQKGGQLLLLVRRSRAEVAGMATRPAEGLPSSAASHLVSPERALREGEAATGVCSASLPAPVHWHSRSTGCSAQRQGGAPGSALVVMLCCPRWQWLESPGRQFRSLGRRG